MLADDPGKLHDLARQIRLDLLTVDVCAVLRRESIPHVVIKGVTTAAWLYEPPRQYRDLDLLVPPKALRRCVNALVSSGLAQASDARLGEEASHSYLLMSTNGAEIDIHVTLPTLDASSGEAVWAVLGHRVVDLELDTGTISALSYSGRCLVLCMHVIASGHDNAQVRDDLRLALETASGDIWRETREMAAELRVSDGVQSAISFISTRASSETNLRLAGLSASTIQLDRLLTVSWPRRLQILRDEIFPSRAFMNRYDSRSIESDLAMANARLVRLARIMKSLPNAVTELKKRSS